MKSKIRDPFAENKAAWFITINTNSTDKKLIGPLRTIWRYFVSHLSKFCYSEHGGRVLGVSERSVIEIGSQVHRVHLHGSIELRGEGHIYLNYSKIKHFIDTQLRQIHGFVGCHFDAQPVKNYNALSMMKSYMELAPVEGGDDDEFRIIESE